MKHIYSIVMALLFALGLANCASLPLDTLNKRIAAFEVTYGEILKTVQVWIDEGRLTGSGLDSVKANIKAVSQARAAMYVAKGVGDIKSAQGQLNAASAALQLVRDYLTRNEKQPSASVKPQGSSINPVQWRPQYYEQYSSCTRYT